ncbi:MAG: SRPBCC family protein [Egibacteraceae bacterium]
MTQHVDTAVVCRTVTVEVPQQRAFELFTAELGSWWPREYSIGETDMADFVLEPKVGGRWYEMGVDGKEYETGRVTAFEPPDRLVLAWHLNENWQYDPDPTHASEVEVRFVAESPTRTRVDLDHRGFERHGGGAEAVHGVVDSPQGWGYCLELFARHAAA